MLRVYSFCFSVRRFVCFRCILSFVILVISHLGFEGGICHVIALVPVHCFLITFVVHSYSSRICVKVLCSRL